MIIESTEGLKLIREYGLDDFPESDCLFHTVDGGIIACRPFLDGVEIHIAFKKGERHKVRSSIPKFCNELNCPVWALIPENRKHTVNSALKCGFIYITKLNRENTDGKMIEWNILKRG